MADLTFSRQPVYLADASNNIAAVLNAAPSSGDYALTTRQVGVAAAAALADGTANPTTILTGVANEVFNGTTFDRQRAVTAALDTAGTGIAAAGVLGQLDDTATATVTENQFAPVRISTRRALLVEGVASGTNLNVNVAAAPNLLVDNAAFTDGTTGVSMGGYIFDEVAGTALTENDAAAARIDSKRAQIGVIEDATTRGQRLAVSSAGRASMDLTGVGGTSLALGQGAMAASIPVVIASNQSAIAIDSELPAAASLADATANPTVPGVGAFLMGYNGTTWDRVRTANTGRLQVDVLSGGGSPAASEIPSLYNALLVYGTTSATASAGTASVTTNTPANTKLFYVRHIVVAASGATKWQVKFGATVLATGFIPQAKLTDTVRFDPPLAGTGDGSTALTIDVTNREASAMDLYARMGAIVQA